MYITYSITVICNSKCCLNFCKNDLANEKGVACNQILMQLPQFTSVPKRNVDKLRNIAKTNFTRKEIYNIRIFEWKYTCLEFYIWDILRYSRIFFKSNEGTLTDSVIII